VANGNGSETLDVLAIDASVARSTNSEGFGLDRERFEPKPFVRLLAEKLALARTLFGADLDLGSGSAIRKLLEISALEDSRTWSALAEMFESSFVVTATGDALSRLGEELGIARPFLEARGTVKLKLNGTLPSSVSEVTIPRGARMLTPGGHHAATEESIALSEELKERDVAVIAFYPGNDHNLNPAQANQKLKTWNPGDPKLDDLFALGKLQSPVTVDIDHQSLLTGGDLQWPDDRYRDLLLGAPRSIWTADAIKLAVSLVPGVRSVQVRDAFGGLDINQSIFGNFNFIERLFGSEREIGSPYYLTILVARTEAAIWEGADGLRAAVESAIEDLRPVSIFPRVEQAELVGVGLSADVVVEGLPLPTGSTTTVNGSAPARALKQRLQQRARRYVDDLDFGEPARAAEVIWALMNEPGVVDLRDPKLLRYPASIEGVDFGAGDGSNGAEALKIGQNVQLQVNQIARFVDDEDALTIV
jgi:hypothetical protein